MQEYAAFFQGDTTICDTTKFSECMVAQPEGRLPENWSQCVSLTGCNSQQLDREQSLVVAKKLNTSPENLVSAIRSLNRDMESKLSFSVRRNKDAQLDIMRSHRREVTGLLEKYGLDAACMMSQPFKVEQMLQKCGSNVEVLDKKNDDVEDNSATTMMIEEPETTFLAATSNSTSSDDDDTTVDGVKLDGYTITIIIVFCLQIFFCFAICVYS